MPKTHNDATELLHYHTPEAWVLAACADPLALLNDHAHLEKKAAANALDLLGRRPDGPPGDRWARLLAAVARDEVEHLAQVVKLLENRGGRISRGHRNPYASALRQLVRAGQGPAEVVDRLLVSALIEARSCERFELLAGGCPDAELAKLYRALAGSERGHYELFVDLARDFPGAGAVDTRWRELLAAEARIIQTQPAGPSMHSGLPPLP